MKMRRRTKIGGAPSVAKKQKKTKKCHFPARRVMYQRKQSVVNQ